MTKLIKSTTNFKLLNFKLLFIIALAVLVPIVLTLAGCKEGGGATMPTIKPTTTTKPTVKKPSTDLGILADHFANKKYTGDTKQYTIDDIIAPKKIISALTNTKISYIKLLRNEILARRGYVFKPEKSKLHGLKLEDIKEILQPAKWYSSNLDFIYADLTKIEIANVSFLKRLEKIEAKRGNFARQLALVVGKDKHDINTDEAMMIFKITKDADVLTCLNPTANKIFEQLIKYKGWSVGNGIYDIRLAPVPGKDKYSSDKNYIQTGVCGSTGIDLYSAVSTSQSNEIYTYGNFILSLKEGDRIYLKGFNPNTRLPFNYVAEVYMNFPITKEGMEKSVPNWYVSFNLVEDVIEETSEYLTIFPYEDDKFFMGAGENVKEISTKTKTIIDIIPSSDFNKIYDKYWIKYYKKYKKIVFETLPWDIFLYSEISPLHMTGLIKIVKFNDSEFYFSATYRPDVRNSVAESRPYKAEWTNDNSLFKGVRIYRYIKVN